MFASCSRDCGRSPVESVSKRYAIELVPRLTIDGRAAFEEREKSCLGALRRESQVGSIGQDAIDVAGRAHSAGCSFDAATAAAKHRIQADHRQQGDNRRRDPSIGRRAFREPGRRQVRSCGLVSVACGFYRGNVRWRQQGTKISGQHGYEGHALGSEPPSKTGGVEVLADDEPAQIAEDCRQGHREEGRRRRRLDARGARDAVVDGLRVAAENERPEQRDGSGFFERARRAVEETLGLIEKRDVGGYVPGHVQQAAHELHVAGPSHERREHRRNGDGESLRDGGIRLAVGVGRLRVRG